MINQTEITRVPTSKEKAAVYYARRGAMVHPLWWVKDDGSCACGKPECNEKDAGKHPIGKWKSERTSNQMKVAELWKEYPDANIGISGFTVIDLDRHERGADGVSAWWRLLDEHGPITTWVVETPGGGFHYYFMPDTEIGNKEGELPAGINVRGCETGYVVAPPSNHVRGVYNWQSGHGLENIEEPAELPPGIKKLIQPKMPLIGTNGHSQFDIREGHRNQTLTSFAGHLLNFRYMSMTTLSENLQSMNKEQCKPPLSVNEVDRIVKSAKDNFERHVPNNQTAFDLSAWDNQIYNPLNVDCANLMAETVIKDLLYECGMTVIAGEGGVGKTTLLMDLVTQAWLGGDVWLSQAGNSNEATRHVEPLSTLYIDFDMGLPLVAISSLLAKHYGVTDEAPGRVHVICDPYPMPDMWDNQQVDQLARSISEHGYDLVVFDSIAFMGGKKSMKDDEFGRCLNEIARIFRAHNLMLLLVHHTNRQGDYFGSAYIQHSATNLVSIKRDGDDILLKVIKNRYGPTGITWKLRRVPSITRDGKEYATFVGMGTMDDSRLTHILRESLERSGDQGLNIAGIIRAFKTAGHGEKKARQTIEEAKADGLIVLHPEAHDRNKLYVWNSPPASHSRSRHYVRGQNEGHDVTISALC